MNKKKSIITLIVLLLVIPTISSLVNIQDNSETTNSLEENQDVLSIDVKNPKPSAPTSGLNHFELWIDDSGVCGNGTWTYIESQYDWCKWTGSEYIIENITLTNPDTLGSPLLIANSTVNFIIKNCTIKNSQLSDTYAGIKLVNASNGIIRDCNISNCYDGIRLDRYMNYDSDNNDIINNSITNINDNGVYMYYADGCTVENNTIDGGEKGIYMRYSDGCTVENNTINGGEKGISMVASDNAVFRNNTIIDSSQFGFESNYNNFGIILSGNTMLKCGVSLSDWEPNMQSATIYPNNTVNGKPVYFYKDQIGLNKNDFTHAGQPGQIILVNCNDSEISGFNVSDASIGIGIHYSENNTIFNNTANRNYYGINLKQECYNNTIFNNTANANYEGIRIYGDCHENKISNNRLEDNINYGIYISNSDYCNITHNLVTGSNYGIGISSEHCIIFNNTLISNNIYGIECSYGSFNLIINNTAIDGFDIGLMIYNGHNNNVTHNVFTDNNFNGVSLFDDCYENNISNNDLSANGEANIYLGGGATCHNNTFTNNNLSNSGKYGVQLDGCHDNIFANNDISNCQQEGVYLDQSNRNNFTGNTIMGNAKGGWDNAGILLTQSDSNTIIDNVIDDNNDDAIYAEDSDKNNITDNTIRYNTERGIYLDSDCDNNFIYLNFFVQNKLHALDDGNNYWNYSIGNYWDNYTDPAIGGVDVNGDGIGDVNYTIYDDVWAFAANDTLPIWDDAAPVITINDPTGEAKIVGGTPNFEVVIQEKYLLKMWYTLDYGLTNVTFTNNGTFNQALWAAVGIGALYITFYAEDKAGQIGFARVLVRKTITSTGASAVADGDDDDDDDAGVVVVVIVIVVLSSIGSGVAVIYVLIQKGILDISKLKRK